MNLKYFFTVASMCLLISTAAQTGIPIPEMTSCDSIVNAFKLDYGLPSVSIAVAKDEKVIYDRSFGTWDSGWVKPSHPEMMYRIASVSKPITKIAIMKLAQEGKFSLSDKVFGAGGLLAVHPQSHRFQYTDPRIDSITVQHLLDHRGGWDRDSACFPDPTPPYPWWYGGCDPLVAPLHVTQTLGVSNPIQSVDMVQFMLQKGLIFSPGSRSSYSNVGYGVLGEVVYAQTGIPYEQYCIDSLFRPNGIYDIHMAEDFYENRRNREVHYIGAGTSFSIDGSGQRVPRQYGGMSINSFGSFGGWIASAKALLKLFVLADAQPHVPDILSQSFRLMGPNGNYFHTGAITGTATVYSRYSNGYSWTTLVNKRITDTARKDMFWQELRNLGRGCMNTLTAVPTHDLLDEPRVPAKNLMATAMTGDSIALSWQNGDGDRRIVIGKFGGTIKNYPHDGSSYVGNLTFGTGNNLGDSTFVLYDGTASNVNIKGITNTGKYYFQVIEYNQSTNTGNHKLYLQGGADQLQVNSCSKTNPKFRMRASILVESNPSSSTSADGKLTFRASGGTKPYSNLWSNGSQDIQISALTAGTYTITVTDANGCTVAENVTIGSSACPPSILPSNLSENYITENTALIDWDAIQGSNVFYMVRYKAAGQANWQTLFTTSHDSLQVSGLTPNTSYLYIVRANCNGNWSGQAFGNFKILSVNCGLPANIGEEWVLTNLAKLVWTKDLNASKYIIRYKDSSSSMWNRIDVNGRFDFYTLNHLTPNVSYDWQIRSACRFDDGSATAWSPIRRFKTKSLSHLCPSSILPTNLSVNYITENTALIDWDAIQGASVYYMVRYKEAGQSNWQTLFTTSEDSLQVSGLTQNTSYLYIVRANCGGNWSGQSFGNFRTLTVNCSLPTNMGEQLVLSNSARLVWSRDINASKYIIHYKDTSSSVWNRIDVNGKFDFYTLNNLSPNTDYVWQIRSACRFDDASATRWSTTRRFTTPPMSSLRKKANKDLIEAKSNSAVVIYPNPSNGIFNLSLNDSLAVAEIEILDIRGRRVYQKRLEIQSVNNLDLRVLGSGLYFMKLPLHSEKLYKLVIQ